MVAGIPDHEFELRRAILASAAFPGLLPPQFLKSGELGLPLRGGAVREKTCLADGGLRDNLGVSFYLSWAKNELPASVQKDLGRFPEHLIIVNSAAPSLKSPGSGSFKRLRTINLCVDVIHQANTQSIISTLVPELSQTAQTTTQVVSIDDDPRALLDAAGEPTPSIQAARDALDRLADVHPTARRAWWESPAQHTDSSIRTRLKKLGPEATANLMFHAYVRDDGSDGN